MFRKIRGLLQSGYPSCRQKAWIISCSHSPASGVQVIRLSFASGLASLSRFASFFSDILARVVNEIEYKNVLKKLKKHDLIADIDDQRSHHFYS